MSTSLNKNIKSKPVKPPLTAEQIRENNITWVLKIEKTAFAFLTLAGLFIPISIFSAGYYKLFGDWLSISGDGKYILGIIGATICFLIYMRYALKSNSKIFIWLGLISLLFDVSFIYLYADFNI